MFLLNCVITRFKFSNKAVQTFNIMDFKMGSKLALEQHPTWGNDGAREQEIIAVVQIDCR